MHIVIFTHPDFTGAGSIAKYTAMIARGMKKRGHEVQVISASPLLYKFAVSEVFKKWMGYVDQFGIFPILFRMNLHRFRKDCLFVFADQALGPWVSLVKEKPHVIHCHDFLAQRAALGEFPGYGVSWTGRIYQKWIRRGYRQGRNFISISQKTQKDLHRFLINPPPFSKVMYNGLNQDFHPRDKKTALKKLQDVFKLNLRKGYILHVGGNQFYKNRKGVIEIYDAWRKSSKQKIPLLMIGPPPTVELRKIKEDSVFEKNINFISDVPDDLLRISYQGANIFLFPSLEEGFGWPIAEAMASGCLVLTTNKAPMTEVGGEACLYLPCRENSCSEEQWARECAKVLDEAINLSVNARRERIQTGLKRATMFDPEMTLDKIEECYHTIVKGALAETVFQASV